MITLPTNRVKGGFSCVKGFALPAYKAQFFAKIETLEYSAQGVWLIFILMYEL